ncbi:MAG: site-2 protease family protein [Candidatus Shapirobacteria bacterium]|nr:site-2 protease family protein [Candidatus Shapirobacteria bacterium]
MVNILFLFFLIIAITIHEFSHALVADFLGDPTPRSHGRLTLNPMAHADLFGTILLPLLSALTGIPTIGWAKPVPIDPYNLANPRRDEFFIAAAGPLSNLLLAIILSLVVRFSGINSDILSIAILINISLAVFNLIPIPPLDGSKIFFNLIPDSESSLQWQKTLDQYGFIILLVLLFVPFGNSSLLRLIMSPIIHGFSNLLIPARF